MSLFNFFKKKNTVKLLPSSFANVDYMEETEGNMFHLNAIFKHLKEEKYGTNLRVTTAKLKLVQKKELFAMFRSQLSGDSNSLSENNILLEGQISGKNFVSVRKLNVSNVYTGQIIIHENGYIDISTKKKSKENRYFNLSYKELKKNNEFIDYFELDMENESYLRSVRMGDVRYLENALYASENDIIFIEEKAQPDDDKRAILEYQKLTGLQYISTDEKNNIWNKLKVNPFLVRIIVTKYDKNNNVIAEKAINKIFKSKKEWIVGYRPAMVYIQDLSEKGENNLMYRLIENEGVYADNSSFKLNFEGKYNIKKVSINEIEGIVKELPFSLDSDKKKLLRNGYEVPEYIKSIYEYGLAQIHAMGLDKIKKDEKHVDN